MPKCHGCSVMKGHIYTGDPSQGLVSQLVSLNMVLGQHRAPESIFTLFLPHKKREQQAGLKGALLTKGKIHPPNN